MNQLLFVLNPSYKEDTPGERMKDENSQINHNGCHLHNSHDISVQTDASDRHIGKRVRKHFDSVPSRAKHSNYKYKSPFIESGKKKAQERSNQYIADKKRTQGINPQWDFDTQTTQLFDPSLHKDEIFKPKPRITSSNIYVPARNRHPSSLAVKSVSGSREGRDVWLTTIETSGLKGDSGTQSSDIQPTKRVYYQRPPSVSSSTGGAAATTTAVEPSSSSAHTRRGFMRATSASEARRRTAKHDSETVRYRSPHYDPRHSRSNASHPLEESKQAQGYSGDGYRSNPTVQSSAQSNPPSQQQQDQPPHPPLPPPQRMTVRTHGASPMFSKRLSDANVTVSQMSREEPLYEGLRPVTGHGHAATNGAGADAAAVAPSNDSIPAGIARDRPTSSGAAVTRSTSPINARVLSSILRDDALLHGSYTSECIPEYRAGEGARRFATTTTGSTSSTCTATGTTSPRTSHLARRVGAPATTAEAEDGSRERGLSIAGEGGDAAVPDTLHDELYYTQLLRDRLKVILSDSRRTTGSDDDGEDEEDREEEEEEEEEERMGPRKSNLARNKNDFLKSQSKSIRKQKGPSIGGSSTRPAASSSNEALMSSMAQVMTAVGQIISSSSANGNSKFNNKRRSKMFPYHSKSNHPSADVDVYDGYQFTKAFDTRNKPNSRGSHKHHPARHPTSSSSTSPSSANSANVNPFTVDLEGNILELPNSGKINILKTGDRSSSLPIPVPRTKASMLDMIMHKLQSIEATEREMGAFLAATAGSSASTTNQHGEVTSSSTHKGGGRDGNSSSGRDGVRGGIMPFPSTSAHTNVEEEEEEEEEDENVEDRNVLARDTFFDESSSDDNEDPLVKQRTRGRKSTKNRGNKQYNGPSPLGDVLLNIASHSASVQAEEQRQQQQGGLGGEPAHSTCTGDYLHQFPKLPRLPHSEEEIQKYKKELTDARNMKDAAFLSRGVSMSEVADTMAQELFDQMVGAVALELDDYISDYSEKFIEKI